jgi:hypothetical protein
MGKTLKGDLHFGHADTFIVRYSKRGPLIRGTRGFASVHSRTVLHTQHANVCE